MLHLPLAPKVICGFFRPINKKIVTFPTLLSEHLFSVCLLSSLPAKTVGSLISKLKKDLLLQLLRSPAVAGRRIKIFNLDAFFVNS